MGYSNQLATQGVYFNDSTSKNPVPYYSTKPIYHTLGIANEPPMTRFLAQQLVDPRDVTAFAEPDPLGAPPV